MIKKLSFLLNIFILLVIPLQLTFLYYGNSLNQKGAVAGIQSSISRDVSVSAFIGGGNKFSLYGYTSPKGYVTLEGMGIFSQTVADDKGYFEFIDQFSPLSKREACLSSKDQLGRLSPPVCLPPFPINYNASIGPVIIPPTVSLNKNDFFMGDEVVLGGQTVPEKEVLLSVFTQNTEVVRPTYLNFLSRITNFIKPVEAFSIPELTAKSDKKGNYSFTLPSSQAQNYRLFTQVNFESKPSSNSNALSLKILPIWTIIIKFFQFLYSLIGPRLLELLVFAEFFYLAYIFIRHSASKAIVLYQNHLPMIEVQNLPTIENNKLPVVKNPNSLIKY